MQQGAGATTGVFCAYRASACIIGLKSKPIMKPSFSHAFNGVRGVVLLALVFSLIGAGLYGWTLGFPMEFDDFMYLKDNPLSTDVRSFAYPLEFKEFANRAAGLGLDPDLSTNFILRPVAYLTFYWNYQLDAYNPEWWRLANVVIHVVNSLLVFALIMLLLAGWVRQGRLMHGSSVFISVTSALLFLVHPLAIESVTYIVQRFTSMGTLFYLLGLCLYFGGVQSVTATRSLALRLSGAGVLLAGMLTKECTFTAPLIAVMLDVVVRGSTLRGALRRAVPLLVLLPVIPVLVLLVSWAQNGGDFSLQHAVNLTNLKDEPWSHWHFLLTQLTVIVEYMRLAVWPTGLNLDPEWPLYRSITDGPVMAAIGWIVVLLGCSFAAYRLFRREPRAALVFAALIWFFTTVFISSGLVPLPDLKAEHRSYLPSIGLFVIVACLLDGLRRWRPSRWAAGLLVLVAAGALSLVTVRRNELWRTQITLWEDTAVKSPNKPRVWGNLGCAHFEVGNVDQAIQYLTTSIAVEPAYQIGNLNLALALNAAQRHSEAIDVLAKFLKRAPAAGHNPEIRCALALALSGVGRNDEGIVLLREVVEVIPTHRLAQLALGLTYKAAGDRDAALHHLKVASGLAPHNTELLAVISRLQPGAGDVGE